jgi:hypothetical protein
MPSKQEEGDGDGAGVPLAGVLGVPLGEVDGLSDGEPLEAGVLDALPLEVGLAGELVPVWPEGLADAFLPDRVAELDAPGVAAPPGTVPPLAGAEVRPAADAPGDGSRLVVGVPAVAGAAGSWFAAGEPLSAPEASSATRPALATRAAPIAKAPVRRRRGRSCWSAGATPRGGDMRSGTSHSSGM